MCTCACVVDQLVTCIPTRSLPRGMTLGAASNQEVEEIEKEIEEEEDAAAAAARRGQILWVRGLSRLQHQVTTPVSRSRWRRQGCEREAQNYVKISCLVYNDAK